MSPPSHRYQFRLQQLLPVVGWTLLPLALFCLFMHLAAAARILPPPCPSLDVDRTILFHQAQASRSRQSADIVLIGDSSCLMDVSVEQLTKLLPGAHAILNLGTLSYLDLRAFASLLAHYQAANPGQLQTVVLLMHPEALRRSRPADYDVAALRHFYAGLDYCGPAVSRPLCLLGVETFRGRVLSRALPLPLPGAFGRDYGFTHDLWRYVSAHRGSARDPGRFDPAAAHVNIEYRLAPSLRSASLAFRAAVPASVKLIAGITPAPQSLTGAGYPQLQRRLLETWGQWLQADGALTETPAALPDDLFASSTHLNARGVRLYTEQLGRALAGHLRAREGPP
jgi:hypothetical protein